ncbi:MAG: hypothetical protein A2Y34_15800 [Spirochaetes bacterium GWC1_27_15]|nr:MAG: hypothetical protein A2Z98_04435 [Spirochaetes bacterium GWB1_27_13]OHD27335.1 MAG: hypothetical protein A2Y34_15800 [Spirochaetes bacterium GWC1_27_15]
MLKKLILPILIILFSSHLFADEIIFNPINKTYIYNNFVADRLYPFAYTNEMYLVDSKVNLKLIEEIESDNFLFGDILKVEIIDGYYKGKIGYILEDYLKLSNFSIKNGLEVYFKENSKSLDGKIIFFKEMRCLIKESRIEEGQEVLVLQKQPYIKEDFIDFANKNSIRYIIDIVSDINYYLRNNKAVIKVVNSQNLFELENVSCGDNLSNYDGIIFCDRKNSYFLEKKGFTKSIIIPQKGENVFLSFIEPVEYIDFKPNFFYEKNNFSFFSDSTQKIGVKVLGDDFSYFCMPDLTDDKLITKDCFYIENIPQNVKLFCNIKEVFHPVYLNYFNEEKLLWETVNLIYEDGSYKLNILKSGYYALLTYQETSYTNLNIIKNAKSSRIFLKNKNNSFIKQYMSQNDDVLKIPINEEVEVISFLKDNPYTLYQKRIRKDDLNIEIISNYTKKEVKKFNKLFYGMWQKTGIKKDNKIIKDIEKNNNILEFFGRMELNEGNKIVFYNDFYKIEGFFELIDDYKIIIYIKKINYPVDDISYGEKYFVSQSVFNSNLVIPAFYSFYGGTLQISFDTIFFDRRMTFKDQNKYDKSIIGESLSFRNYFFPQTEDNCKYKIYFFKE